MLVLINAIHGVATATGLLYCYTENCQKTGFILFHHLHILPVNTAPSASACKSQNESYSLCFSGNATVFALPV